MLNYRIVDRSCNIVTKAIVAQNGDILMTDGPNIFPFNANGLTVQLCSLEKDRNGTQIYAGDVVQIGGLIGRVNYGNDPFGRDPGWSIIPLNETMHFYSPDNCGADMKWNTFKIVGRSLPGDDSWTTVDYGPDPDIKALADILNERSEGAGITDGKFVIERYWINMCKDTGSFSYRELTDRWHKLYYLLEELEKELPRRISVLCNTEIIRIPF